MLIAALANENEDLQFQILYFISGAVGEVRKVEFRLGYFLRVRPQPYDLLCEILVFAKFANQ